MCVIYEKIFNLRNILESKSHKVLSFLQPLWNKKLNFSYRLRKICQFFFFPSKFIGSEVKYGCLSDRACNIVPYYTFLV